MVHVGIDNFYIKCFNNFTMENCDGKCSFQL